MAKKRKYAKIAGKKVYDGDTIIVIIPDFSKSHLDKIENLKNKLSNATVHIVAAVKNGEPKIDDDLDKIDSIISF